MKIALIGATGYVGSKILTEALERGHQVTGIVRHVEDLSPHRNLTPRQEDVLQVGALAHALAGHDVVVSAFNPARRSRDPNIYEQHVAGHTAIIAAVKQSGVKRFIAVGGAASLKMPSGKEYLDSPEFPDDYKPFLSGIRGTRALYYLLKDETDLDWVFLAPSSRVAPGDRTGKYRVGTDYLLFDASGQSFITLEDYAVAMLDEIEQPKHHRQRFTVGY